jgi:hypothetical protein
MSLEKKIENPIYLKFKSPHYSFFMTVNKVVSPVYNSYYFIIGDKNDPCLEGIITLDSKTNDIRYKSFENKSHLIKINSLVECSIEDITNEYQDKYSFGKELLDTVLFFINSQFPKIQTIKLTDTSYIPCKRNAEDTLDLLSYSIALYKETWYEKQKGAYILPKEKHILYRSQVKKYASKERKAELDFDLFYRTIFPVANSINREMIDNNIEIYKQIYNSSETFPEFFIKVSKTLKKEDKCKFFKGWLYDFIASQILIERTWYIDLFPKIEVVSSINIKLRKRNQTRRKNTKN